jgi:hypothetical protein
MDALIFHLGELFGSPVVFRCHLVFSTDLLHKELYDKFIWGFNNRKKFSSPEN